MFQPNCIKISRYKKTDTSVRAGEAAVFSLDDINCNKIHLK